MKWTNNEEIDMIEFQRRELYRYFFDNALINLEAIKLIYKSMEYMDKYRDILIKTNRPIEDNK